MRVAPVELYSVKIWHCSGQQRSRRPHPSPWRPSGGSYAEAGEHSSVCRASSGSHSPSHGIRRRL